MIIAVTFIHRDEKTGQKKLVVSHGIDREAGKQIVLPCEHPKDIGATWNESLREWVIPSK